MTTPDTIAATGRISTARQLLHRQHIRDSVTLARQPSLRNAALAGVQAALTLAIALPLIEISPWPQMIGYGSLGALVALFGRFAPSGQRSRIVLFCALIQISAVLLMSLATFLGASASQQLLLLALFGGVSYFLTVTGQFGPPGMLIFVFAAGAAMAPVGSWGEIAQRVLATGVVAALGWTVCRLSERLRHAAGPDRHFPVEPLRPLSHRLIASIRIAMGTGVAAFGSHALGAHHPVWAAMGAIVVIQSQYLHLVMARAAQRMAGTMAGAVLVWLILIHQPSVWAIIAILIMLQFSTEMIIGTNYGLGQILVTPMALLMSYLAAPQSTGAAMASERVLDTLLGIALGMLVALVFSTLDDRAYFARHHASKLAAG
ncbi:FUSC family protein [Paracoccus aestuariivivens]|uniref:FUSC family protein n=1 Tax=Paracoccus aestuariivivens TaxID=1820333 RepID=A0A6L6JAK5_9RHOB|nr:FUSC family protein [Paracoccus aestuariivivens]MTH79223.1 FUSC family protein [Paracoccus aestuariivivens]